VTPGTNALQGQYVNDFGQVQPWTAHYDEFGRMIGRTDFNAGNAAAGIPDIIIIRLNGDQEKLQLQYLTMFQGYMYRNNLEVRLGIFTMNKREQLINDFYHTHKGFGFLQSFHLYRDEEDADLCNLDIVLGVRQSPEKKLLIHFSGVIDFRSGNLDSLYTLFINITDVSADQMEGINYRIREDEFELFSFRCNNFEFQLV
jgi:hypothetical protein